MVKKPKFLIGLAVLAVVGLVLVGLMSLPKPPPEAIPTPIPTEVPMKSLKVYGGLILLDPQVIEYLRVSHKLDVSETMMGSFAQAEAPLEGVDCVWPGSETAADYYQSLHSADAFKAKRIETIFQTYLTIYTWAEYLPTLEKAGYVTTENGVHFLKVKPLMDAMAEGKTWADLGVNIPGYVDIKSTDPLKSSSGMVWLELMASYEQTGGENGGQVATLDRLPPALPVINAYWEAQGNQSDASPKLFSKFIGSGAGMPMIVNYESAYTEFVNSLPEDQKAQAEKIVGLYPEWTVNTEHILISITDACKELTDVLLTDQWIKEYAWAKFGMRNGQGGIEAKPGDVSIPWLATSVNAVSEPKKPIVDAIKEVLK